MMCAAVLEGGGPPLIPIPPLALRVCEFRTAPLLLPAPPLLLAAAAESAEAECEVELLWYRWG